MSSPDFSCLWPLSADVTLRRAVPFEGRLEFASLPCHIETRAMDDLLKYRAEFPILDRTTYLNSNSLGAMPRGGLRHSARLR